MVGEYLGHTLKNEKLVIGKDPRQSSDMLEHALAAGAASQGAQVYLAGTVATPALAYILKENGFSAGVMISASHNPYVDNGLKVFGSEGFKIPADLEDDIERYIKGEIKLNRPDHIGNIHYYSDGIEHYIKHLEDSMTHRLDGLKVVLDLANGSSVTSAKRLFEGFGANVILMNDTPNGTNINHNGGSTHMDYIAKAVVEHKADMGFAFDGDADRCLAVDELGNIIDGDKILYILGKDMLATNHLNKNTVVSTVMSNLGFLKSMKKLGINVIQTDVGDKNVVAEMMENDYVLGGEQSGHIVLKEFATTGDGVLTAIKMAEIIAKNKTTMHTISNECMTFPQVLINVKVKDKNVIMSNRLLQDKIKKIADSLEDEGRILVRPSGTENLLRVMVEAKTQEVCQKLADEVVNLIVKL